MIGMLKRLMVLSICFVSLIGRTDQTSPQVSEGVPGTTTYTITYNGNGNTGGSVPTYQVKTNGVNLILRTNLGSLVRTGYTFAGWNTAANGSGTWYASGGTYSANAGVTLYAKWKAIDPPGNQTVTSPPVWAQGSFNGLVEVDGQTCGVSTMTVSSAGKISGTLRFARKSYSFSAASYSKIDEAGAFCLSTTATMSGQTALPLELRIFVPDATDATVPKNLSRVEGVLNGTDGVTLYRDVSKDSGMSAVLAKFVGSYVCGTFFSSSRSAALTVNTLTVEASGAVTAAGLVDGIWPVSASGTLTFGENGTVWANLYTNYGEEGWLFAYLSFERDTRQGEIYVRFEDGNFWDDAVFQMQ